MSVCALGKAASPSRMEGWRSIRNWSREGKASVLSQLTGATVSDGCVGTLLNFVPKVEGEKTDEALELRQRLSKMRSMMYW